jgi:hypothetical protein
MGAIIAPKERLRTPEQVEKRGEKMLIAPAKNDGAGSANQISSRRAGVLTCPIELSASRVRSLAPQMP